MEYEERKSVKDEIECESKYEPVQEKIILYIIKISKSYFNFQKKKGSFLIFLKI